MSSKHHKSSSRHNGDKKAQDGKLPSEKDGRHKKSKHKKKTSQSNGSKNSGVNNPPPPPRTLPHTKEGGVTVAKFRTQQQNLQDEAATYKNKNSLSQQRRMIGMQNNGGGSSQDDEQPYYNDSDSDDDSERRNRGAIVAAAHINANNQRQQNTEGQIVDTIPADHPSSSIIQTHRTCTLCQRTLPRSQFSERDRYTINVSLAPGLTCRTCSMTVAAVKLKGMPSTEALLFEYAQRGVQQGLLALEQSGGVSGHISGYLESSEVRNVNYNNNQNENIDDSALVVRQSTGAESCTMPSSIGIGQQLALYGRQPSPVDSMASSHNLNMNTNGPNNNSNNNNLMGMGNKDVNSSFSGKAYGHTDSDRSPNIANCKYIDALLQLPSYLNLNAFGLFMNCQDVSVSMAALEAVRLYGTLDEGCFVPHDCDGVPISNEKEKTDNEANKVNPKSVVCIVLGEGSTPRTAILASQHYGWTTIAIDPKLSEDWDGYHDDIPNFTGYSVSISDFMDDNGGEFSETMIEFSHEGVQHLVIIGVQHTKDSLRLKGNGHINEIRSRYEDVPTTLVSLSPVRKATLAPTQRRIGQCGSKLEKDVGYEPNLSYLDEAVFSDTRQIEVWNFHNAEGDDDEEDNYIVEAEYARLDSESGPPVNNKKEEDEVRPKISTFLEDKVSQFKQNPDNVKAPLAVLDKRDAKARGANDSYSTLSTRGTLKRREHALKDEGVVNFTPGGREGLQKEDSKHKSDENITPEGIWSPPDNEDATKVWENAMQIHNEQQQQETLCIDDDLNNKVQDDQADDPQRGLPPNWEAIHDPNTGDYYYNNWVSDEVTWDRPDPESSPSPDNHSHGQQGNEEDDCSADSATSYDKKMSAITSDNSDNNINNAADSSQLIQGGDNSDSSCISDSNYVFGHDDQSSASVSISMMQFAMLMYIIYCHLNCLFLVSISLMYRVELQHCHRGMIHNQF